MQVAVFTRTESWKGVSFCTSIDMISGEAIIAQSENCAMDWSSVRLRFLLLGLGPNFLRRLRFRLRFRFGL